MTPMLFALLAAPARADTVALGPRRWEKLQRVQGRPRCVDGMPCNVLAVTPSIPVTLTKLELEPVGTERVGTDLAVGPGVSFALYRGTLVVDADRPRGPRRTVEGAAPLLFAGVAAQVGGTESVYKEFTGIWSWNVLVGTRWLALSYGDDLRFRAPSVGLMAHVGGTAVLPGASLAVGAWR